MSDFDLSKFYRKVLTPEGDFVILPNSTLTPASESQPVPLSELVPEGVLAERPVISPVSSAPSKSQLRKRKSQLRKQKQTERQLTRRERRAEQDNLPPVNPELTGTEAKLDAFLRGHKRCFDWLRNKPLVVQIVEEIHSRPEISFAGLETYVKRLYDLTKTANHVADIVPAKGQILVPQLMGYWSWSDMKAAALVNRNNVKNLLVGQELEFRTGRTLLQVKEVADVLQKKKAGIVTRGPLKPSQTEIYNGTQLAGKFNSAQIGELINDYVAMYRMPRLVGDKDELRNIAVKRFFGMNSFEELTPYIIAKVFPPQFKPHNVEQKEVRLFFHIRKSMLEGEKHTAMTAFLKLKPWCATPEVERELERVIGELADGKPNRYAQFVRRKYGVVLLVLDQKAGCGFITENNKITRIIKLTPKEREEPGDTMDSSPDEERQPEFHEPPRIVLTSHEPAFQSAFRELNKRR